MERAKGIRWFYRLNEYEENPASVSSEICIEPGTLEKVLEVLSHTAGEITGLHEVKSKKYLGGMPSHHTTLRQTYISNGVYIEIRLHWNQSSADEKKSGEISMYSENEEKIRNMAKRLGLPYKFASERAKRKKK